MRLPGFIGPAYTLDSRLVECQKCINLYLEKNELGTGKEPMSLMGTPGLTSVAVSPNGAPWRALYYSQPYDALYGVAGNKVYRIASNWTVTELLEFAGGAFTLANSAGRVRMASSGQFISGTVTIDPIGSGQVFVIDQSTNRVGTSTGSPATRQFDITFKDGRFVVVGEQTGTASGRFWWSDLMTSSVPTWPALGFAVADSNPDALVSCVNAMGYLWLGGPVSIEIWQTSPDPLAPYQKVQGTTSDTGVIGPTLTAVAGGVAWLGNRQGAPMVFACVGGLTPQRISNHGVETALKGYSTVSDATSFAFSLAGHDFFVLTFPTANSTWLYDFSTGAWSQWLSYNVAPASGGVLGRHRASCHAFAYGLNVVGDATTSSLYTLSSSVYLDGTLPITRQRTSPHLQQDMRRLFHAKFQLDMEVGVGNPSAVNPVVEYQYSYDGGYNWSAWKSNTFGAAGARLTRVVWRMLGSDRDRVHRIRTSEPVKVRILGADVEVR